MIKKILFLKAENQEEQGIYVDLTKGGFDKLAIDEAFNALDEDVILTVKSLPYLTPLFPVTYRIGVNKIEKRIEILNGIIKNTYEIAIRTIDKVEVDRNLISADVKIIHSNESIVKIASIHPKDAKRIEDLYCGVIEAQRRRVINVSQD